MIIMKLCNLYTLDSWNLFSILHPPVMKYIYTWRLNLEIHFVTCCHLLSLAEQGELHKPEE